mmetsp:Transcript_19572/g.32700  ORF Transcript_19572/g.32700 Transcript_19572/m.32700 type:complete len:202 (-) Transcript_19572:82-687(-)
MMNGLQPLLTDVVLLYRDWKTLKWSQTKLALAIIGFPFLVLGIVNFPSIWIILSIWSTISTLLLYLRKRFHSLPYGLSSRKIATIPGSCGLPFVGESVSFLASSRNFFQERLARYGCIFQTAIDFSGTCLRARRVVVLCPTTTSTSTTCTGTDTRTTTTTTTAAPYDMSNNSLSTTGCPSFTPGYQPLGLSQQQQQQQQRS